MVRSFKDRFFLVRLARDEKKVQIALLGVALLLLLLLGNSFYLTMQSIKKEARVLPNTLPLTSLTPPPSPTPIQSGPTTAPRPVQQTNQGSGVKEYFIPLGTGSSNALDWTDVPGLTAQIDFGNYPSIKEIHFEASVAIPTA